MAFALKWHFSHWYSPFGEAMNMTAKLAISHYEIRVSNLEAMETFYTQILGFIVTDRSSIPRGPVFLSSSPDEHYQIILTPNKRIAKQPTHLDHIAFRVGTLKELRSYHNILKAHLVAFETVSHGSSWSIYLKDPEANQLEIFTDTPWFVEQPTRFPINLMLPDKDLLKETEDRVKSLVGFKPINDWSEEHLKQFEE